MAHIHEITFTRFEAHCALCNRTANRSDNKYRVWPSFGWVRMVHRETYKGWRSSSLNEVVKFLDYCGSYSSIRKLHILVVWPDFCIPYMGILYSHGRTETVAWDKKTVNLLSTHWEENGVVYFMRLWRSVNSPPTCASEWQKASGYCGWNCDRKI